MILRQGYNLSRTHQGEGKVIIFFKFQKRIQQIQLLLCNLKHNAKRKEIQ